MQRVIDFYQQEGSTHSKNTPELLTTTEQVSQFLRDHAIETVLLDCDGVLYRSPDAVPGAAEAVRSLLLLREGSSSKQVFFVTNNAASSRRQLRDKLTAILQLDGGDDNLLTPEMMVSSSYACATYLRQELVEKNKGSSPSSPPSAKKVFVIGSEGLCEELRQAGLDVRSLHHQQGADDDDDDEAQNSMSRDELAAHDFSQLHPVGAVVVGHDTAFNFRQLRIANVLLQWNPEALLVATNMDAFDLVGADGRHIPGNGSLVRSIEYASKRAAVNVGKPSRTLMELMAHEHGIDVERSLIVGDRLDTDIRFGVDSGMRSALVLTGVTTADTLRRLQGGTEDEPLPTGRTVPTRQLASMRAANGAQTSGSQEVWHVFVSLVAWVPTIERKNHFIGKTGEWYLFTIDGVNFLIMGLRPLDPIWYSKKSNKAGLPVCPFASTQVTTSITLAHSSVADGMV